MVTPCKVRNCSRALTNWLGNSFRSALGKLARDLHRARGGVDQIVDELDHARRNVLVVGTVGRNDHQLLAGALLLPDFLDEILGQHEDHGNRLQLGEHHDAVGVGEADVISRIDQAQTNPAADRGTMWQ